MMVIIDIIYLNLIQMGLGVFGYTVDRVRIFNKHMLNNYTERGTSILNFDSNFNYTSVVNFPSMSQIKYPYFDRNSNKIFIGFYLEDDMCINNSLYNGLILIKLI